MIPAFAYNLRSELLKCKRTAAIWLTIAGAFFIPFINVLKCVLRPDFFVPMVSKNPWDVWLDFNWQIAAFFLLTIYIILVTSLILQVEFRNNAFKQVYASPRSYADIYFSKFLVVHLVILACFILFNLAMIGTAFLTQVFNNDYKFTSEPFPIAHILSISLRMYGAMLGIISIQFWMSIRFSNFILPLGVGLALFIGGFMIRQWEHIDIYPYMYSLLVYASNPGLTAGTAAKALRNSGIWMVAVAVFGFLDVVRMKQKG